jgi:hypothetical protein
MIRFKYNGIPGTVEQGEVSFAGTRLAGTEGSINAEARTYADTHLGYWPDHSEIVLMLLRETGKVEIVFTEPPEYDPDKVY